MAAYASGNPGELVARAGAIPGKYDLQGCKSYDEARCLPPWMAAYTSGNPGELVARAGTIPGKYDLQGCKSYVLSMSAFFRSGTGNTHKCIRERL
jgi:hypothetical protein